MNAPLIFGRSTLMRMGLFLMLLALPLSGSAASGVELVGQIGGVCKTVAVQDQYAYLGEGGGAERPGPGRPRASGAGGPTADAQGGENTRCPSRAWPSAAILPTS